MGNKVDMATSVVIVGGGPGGCGAAITLGSLNIPTILVDQKSRGLIGKKVCGDGLAKHWIDKAQELVHLPSPTVENGSLKEICSTIAVEVINNGHHIFASPNEYEGYTVDRHAYGQVLIDAVEGYDSVTILPETRVNGILFRKGRIQGIRVEHKGVNHIITAKIVIDASGYVGAIRKNIPPDIQLKFPRKISREQTTVAYREILRTDEPHGIQHSLIVKYTKEMSEHLPGYVWAFSRGKDELNFGIGYLNTKENTGKHLKELYETIRNTMFPRSETIQSQGALIPSRLPLPSCVHHNLLLVGDAAALANPVDGEGHGPALLSGIKAALFASQAITDNDTSEEKLWDYNKWIWTNFGAKYVWGVMIAKFLKKYDIDVLEWLIHIGIIQADLLYSSILQSKANINYFSVFLRSWTRPLLLLSMINILRLIKQLQKHANNYPDYNEFEVWHSRLKYLEEKSI